MPEDIKDLDRNFSEIETGLIEGLAEDESMVIRFEKKEPSKMTLTGCGVECVFQIVAKPREQRRIEVEVNYKDSLDIDSYQALNRLELIHIISKINDNGK